MTDVKWHIVTHKDWYTYASTEKHTKYKRRNKIWTDNFQVMSLMLFRWAIHNIIAHINNICAIGCYCGVSYVSLYLGFINNGIICLMSAFVFVFVFIFEHLIKLLFISVCDIHTITSSQWNTHVDIPSLTYTHTKR